MPTTRRDASLAHRPVLPRITLRTYVRTYVRSLFVPSLSLFLSSSRIPRFPRAYIDASREREIDSERVRARVCVCVCVYPCIPLYAIHRGGIHLPRFLLPFYRVFQSSTSQCANIINGKVSVYVTGRIVAKGCIRSPGYSHFATVTYPESDPRESCQFMVLCVKMRTVVDRSRTLEWDVDRELRELVLSW